MSKKSCWVRGSGLLASCTELAAAEVQLQSQILVSANSFLAGSPEPSAQRASCA
jgi:hypothetical protein